MTLAAEIEEEQKFLARLFDAIASGGNITVNSPGKPTQVLIVKNVISRTGSP